MKRILVITMLVIAASSSFALVRSATQKAGATEDALIAQEKQIIESLKKKDSAAFKNLVAEDATLVGPMGVNRAGAVIPMIFSPDYTLESVTVENPQVRMIDKDAALLTYKTTGTESYKGQSETSTGYASTLWVKQGDRWVAMFHQESMARPAQQQKVEQ